MTFIVMSPPLSAPMYPPSGTLLSTYCSGTTKMGHYADGNGGTYDGTIEVNSTDCGYNPNLQGGGGALRINTAWDGDCDVDIHTTSPDGYQYGYSYAGGGNGVWDYDSTTAGQENVAWNPTAASGTYTHQLVNYNGNTPGTITVTIIYLGVTHTVDMSPYLDTTAGARSTKSISFSIDSNGFTQVPYLV